LFGLIYFQPLRRSATGRTAAYHVGTRRRRLFLVNIINYSRIVVDIPVSVVEEVFLATMNNVTSDQCNA